MLRLTILGVVSILMMTALHGAAMETGATILPDVYAVAAVTDIRPDSTYMLPEMVITAPRIVDGEDYSYERYRYGRIYLQAASRRLIRIAGYMIMATLSVTLIVLAISRIPHINRARSKKKHHPSYVYLARTKREPWTAGRKP